MYYFGIFVVVTVVSVNSVKYCDGCWSNAKPEYDTNYEKDDGVASSQEPEYDTNFEKDPGVDRYPRNRYPDSQENGIKIVGGDADVIFREGDIFVRTCDVGGRKTYPKENVVWYQIFDECPKVFDEGPHNPVTKKLTSKRRIELNLTASYHNTTVFCQSKGKVSRTSSYIRLTMENFNLSITVSDTTSHLYKSGDEISLGEKLTVICRLEPSTILETITLHGLNSDTSGKKIAITKIEKITNEYNGTNLYCTTKLGATDRCSDVFRIAVAKVTETETDLISYQQETDYKYLTIIIAACTIICVGVAIIVFLIVKRRRKRSNDPNLAVQYLDLDFSRTNNRQLPKAEIEQYVQIIGVVKKPKQKR